MRSYLGSRSYPKIFHAKNCFASITVCYLYILGSYSLGRRNLPNRKQTGRCAAFWKAEKHFRWVYRYWFLRYCEYHITLECHQNLNIQLPCTGPFIESLNVCVWHHSVLRMAVNQVVMTNKCLVVSFYTDNSTCVSNIECINQQILCVESCIIQCSMLFC